MIVRYDIIIIFYHVSYHMIDINSILAVDRYLLTNYSHIVYALFFMILVVMVLSTIVEKARNWRYADE